MGDVVDEVVALELILLTPEVRSVRERVAALLHPAFSEVGASGRVWSRDEVLDEIHLDPGPIEASDVAGARLADDVVLVTYTAHRPESRSRRAALWVRDDGEWRTAYHHGQPMTGDEPDVRLLRWSGPWADDDPDANFKTDVALYSALDPVATLQGLSASIGVPVGALARYVLARWATGGSGGLLELGPTTLHRLCEPVDRAEAAGTDAARLGAYDQLRQMLSWLRFPLDHPESYGDNGPFA